MQALTRQSRIIKAFVTTQPLGRKDKRHKVVFIQGEKSCSVSAYCEISNFFINFKRFRADQSPKTMKVLLGVSLLLQVLELGDSVPATAEEFLARRPCATTPEGEFTTDLDEFCKEEQRQNKIDKVCILFMCEKCSKDSKH